MAWKIKKYGGEGNVSIEDEGSLIKSDVNVLNFVGVGVQAKDEGDLNKINIYIPPTVHASFFNQDDSIVSDINTTERYVSSPSGAFNIGVVELFRILLITQQYLIVHLLSSQ